MRWPILTASRPVGKLNSMFRHRPWSHRAGIAVILLASLLLSTGALPHAESFDDIACSPLPVSHDQDAHHIGAGRTSSHSDAQHCFVCHSLRSFHAGFDTFEHRAEAQRPERLHAAPIDAITRVEWALVPGRAPPA